MFLLLFMTKIRRFRTKVGFNRYVAFQHIHGLSKGHGPYPRILIHGKPHKVVHKK